MTPLRMILNQQADLPALSLRDLLSGNAFDPGNQAQFFRETLFATPLGYISAVQTCDKSRLQCAGLNRHEAEEEEALRVRTSDPPGLESCAAAASNPAKRRQSYRRGGYSAPKR